MLRNMNNQGTLLYSVLLLVTSVYYAENNDIEEKEKIRLSFVPLLSVFPDLSASQR